MTGISAFLTAFCAGCVLIGALTLLCPDGSMQKPVRVVFSLVFLASVLASALPARLALPEFSAAADSPAQTEALTAAAAEYTYSLALSRSGINFSEIHVYTDKAADGSISISKVVIHSPCEPEKIMEALGAAAQNYEVEIRNE